MRRGGGRRTVGSIARVAVERPPLRPRGFCGARGAASTLVRRPPPAAGYRRPGVPPLATPVAPQQAHPIAGRAARFETATVLSLSLGHFVHDMYPAFLGPLLPLLIAKLGLSLALAGTLPALLRWSSIIQPFMGYFADRMDGRYWVILAPTATGLCLSLLGLAPSYLGLVVLLVLSGLSHAAFHPAGAAMVSHASGTSWGRGTSFFMTGGELARAVGPLYIVAVVQAVGLELSWIAVVPAVLASLMLYGRIGRAPRLALKPPQGSFVAAIRRAGRPLLFLSAVITLRSFVNVGFTAFFPTYLMGQGASLWLGGMAVAVFELAGAGGAFVGGPLSDRLGRRGVLIVSQLLAIPLLLGSVLAPPGPGQLVLLGAAGVVQFLQGPVQITAVQELMPENRAQATGIVFFLGLEGATIGALLLGVVGDAFGLGSALLASVLLSLVSIPLVFAVPETRHASRGHA